MEEEDRKEKGRDRHNSRVPLLINGATGPPSVQVNKISLVRIGLIDSFCHKLDSPEALPPYNLWAYHNSAAEKETRWWKKPSFSPNPLHRWGGGGETRDCGANKSTFPSHDWRHISLPPCTTTTIPALMTPSPDKKNSVPPPTSTSRYLLPNLGD